MNTPASTPAPASPSLNKGANQFCPTVVRVGWLVYFALLLLAFFDRPFPLPITFAVMALCAYAIARAGTQWHRIGGIVALLCAAAATTLVITASFQAKDRSRRIHARITILNFVAAVKQYETEFGAPPAGNPGEVTRTLLGDNSRKVEFFEAPPSEISASGELLDPWGSPYHIDLSNPANPKVYSFGENRRDDGGADGSDDICSWK